MSDGPVCHLHRNIFHRVDDAHLIEWDEEEMTARLFHGDCIEIWRVTPALALLLAFLTAKMEMKGG